MCYSPSQNQESVPGMLHSRRPCPGCMLSIAIGEDRMEDIKCDGPASSGGRPFLCRRWTPDKRLFVPTGQIRIMERLHTPSPATPPPCVANHVLVLPSATFRPVATQFSVVVLADDARRPDWQGTVTTASAAADSKAKFGYALARLPTTSAPRMEWRVCCAVNAYNGTVRPLEFCPAARFAGPTDLTCVDHRLHYPSELRTSATARAMTALLQPGDLAAAKARRSSATDDDYTIRQHLALTHSGVWSPEILALMRGSRLFPGPCIPTQLLSDSEFEELVEAAYPSPQRHDACGAGVGASASDMMGGEEH